MWWLGWTLGLAMAGAIPQTPVPQPWLGSVLTRGSMFSGGAGRLPAEPSLHGTRSLRCRDCQEQTIGVYPGRGPRSPQI